MKASWIIRVVSVAIVALTGIAAGADDGFEAPEIEAQGAWLTYVALAVFVAATAVVAFKHSHRTHLD